MKETDKIVGEMIKNAYFLAIFPWTCIQNPVFVYMLRKNTYNL